MGLTHVTVEREHVTTTAEWLSAMNVTNASLAKTARLVSVNFLQLSLLVYASVSSAEVVILSRTIFKVDLLDRVEMRSDTKSLSSTPLNNYPALDHCHKDRSSINLCQ